nr:zinc finger, CCHC-type, retrotransposon Gag domain protein [Tanacetum cinerariifolium]
IREEFCTSSGPSDSGGNPPPVTIHTWLERFNKQKPRSFEKATAPVDAENWISHMEKIFDQSKGGDAWLITVTWAEFNKLFFLQFFPRAEQERLKREAAAGTEEEQAKNFQQKSGDRHQLTTHQSSHRNHGHNNDRHGSDKRGGGDNHRSSNNNYSGNNNRETGVSSPTDLSILVPSSPEVPQRATPTRSALRVDADTQESVVKLLMVNTRTDADLSAAVQNALQTLLPQIREELRTSSGPSNAGGNPSPVTIHTWLERFNKQKPRSFEKATAPIRPEIREEFRISSGPSDSGGNPPPVTIHTWLERFNNQKPHSFEKAIAPVDEVNWISHMEKIFDVMGCEDAFKTRLAVYKFEG